MPAVIAIDAGTTGVRAAAYDGQGKPIGYRYQEFPQYFPRPGWVEHDAEEIWQAVVSVLGGLVSSLDQPIAAIGIGNQRETVVVWDRRTSRPLHRAIVWQDRRTAARCGELAEEGHLDLVRKRTGLVLDPYFSGTKLAWLFSEGAVEPAPQVAAGTIDTWLLWKLSGGQVHATEPTNASRTLLFDIDRLAWSPELCSLLGVPEHVLPEVRPTAGRFGVTAAVDGLPGGVPIAGMAGDQQAALFGQACFAPGDTKNTYGTGSFVLMNVGSQRPAPVEGLLTTVAWHLPAGICGDADRVDYALEGAIFITGAAIQWLRDGLGIITDAAETEQLAASVDDAGGVVMVPAFTGLGSPWWDPHARGTVLGITRGTARAHLARAAVEAMAFSTRDVVDAMQTASGHRVRSLKADGGASVMNLLLQLQADQLGVTVSRPVVQETTALGAAYLAGLAEGVWSSLSEVQGNWTLDHAAEPGADREAADAAFAQWRRGIERSRHWAAG